MGETETDAQGVETGGDYTAASDEGVDVGTDETSTESDNGTDTRSSTAEEEGQSDQNDDEEPPVRKPRTNADWVALRKQRKIERLESKKTEEDQGEDADDDDISPEDASIIDKRVAKAIAPILADREKEQLTGEINTFVADNPDFKPFAKKVEKWAEHPSWKNVPIDRIFFAAAGPELLKIGAQRKADADRKATETRTGGSTTAPAISHKSVSDMTDQEFEAYQQRVKLGKK